MCNAELLSTTCLLRFNETCYGELENYNSPINATMIHIAKFSIFQVTKGASDGRGSALFLLISALFPLGSLGLAPGKEPFTVLSFFINVLVVHCPS